MKDCVPARRICRTVDYDLAGCKNPADALTKEGAVHTGDLLEQAFADGTLPVSVDNRRHYGPALEEES